MKRMSTKVVAILASFGLTAASSVAMAADKYAVVSAIGNELTIVTYQPSVGSNLDSNLRQVVPLSDDSFDQVASRAAETAIRKVVPDAVTVVMPSPDKSVYLHDDAAAQRIDLSAEQLRGIEKNAAETGARYLVIITKSKGDTRLKFRSGGQGQGKLFGIGYYFDRIKRVYQTETGKSDRGFLSPYAYLMLTVVDLQTGIVIATKTVNETSTIGSAISPTETHPWDAVPAEMKVRALNGLIRRAVVETVPEVLTPT